jgi:adenylate kinase family enzyme
MRVLVGGISGVGKTTFARALAGRSGLPYHEMDALFHGPGWVPRESFITDVAQIASQDQWVFDSHGYTEVKDLVWSRADTLVWLDYSRPVVMSRVLRRSTARALGRAPIFNGNVEHFKDWADPTHPVQWAWTQFTRRRSELTARTAEEQWSHLHVVRLRSPRAAARWLASAASAG